MRAKHVVFSLLALAATSLACSQATSDGETTEGAATEEELAKASLKILGAKIPGADGNCGQCHDINRATLKLWSERYKATMAVLRDETKSIDERINYMRRDPADPRSTFAPAKLGVFTAGAHLGTAGLVNATRHPTAYAQGRILSKLFEGREDDYAHFRDDTRMPIEASYDRLSAVEYETLAQWFEQGLPKMAEILPEEARPTTCTDDFAGLKEHVRSARASNWSAVNKDNRMPMFACDASGNALECFKQKNGEADIFPDAKNTEYGKDWAQEGSAIRIVRALDYTTFFWMRTSSNGQFVANGGGPRRDGASAVIADLGAALSEGEVKTRDIMAQASYDPDFSPRDDWFMFQGTSRGGVLCPMSMLRNPATTKVTFQETECSPLTGIRLYQTVGQALDDNSISDSFIVNSTFASDNPGMTASDHDLELTAGPNASVDITVAIPKGNDAEEGYTVTQKTSLPTPFRGDTMMARSGHLIGSRVAGESGHLGYEVDKLTFSKTDSRYSFALRPVGRICMPGNKANFSFDERFLVTHHYLTRADFASDAEFEPYKAKGAADIYIADFATGEKKRITRMAPGQFAIFPHFRSDGWLYFLVRDANQRKEFVVTSDYAVRAPAP